MQKTRMSRIRVVLSAAAFAVVTSGGVAVAAEVTGTTGNDTLNGTSAADVIRGLAGHDNLRGLGGPDVLYGDAGYDDLDGGPGDDDVYGGFGPDQFSSNDAGTDRLLGGGQRDIIIIIQGSGTARGNAGDDVMDVDGPGTWSMYGDDGPDSLTARGTGTVRLDGGADNDTLTTYATAPGVRSYGGPGDDRIYVDGQGDGLGGLSSGVWGGAGADLIILQACCGGRAVGPLVGGDGDDFIASQNSDADVVSCGPGQDRIRIDLEDDFSADCEVVEHRISGTNGDDTLTGTRFNDIFDDYGGADLLSGRIGDDTFYLGAGRDTVFGGLGNDEISAELDGEPDSITCGDGVDEVAADPTDAVAENCERVTIYYPSPPEK
jgi:Ca2+-binding RTX toxin-like protein